MSSVEVRSKHLAIILVLVLLVGGALLAACGPTDEPDEADEADDPEDPAEPEEEPADDPIGDTLIIAQGIDPMTMAPQEHANSATAAAQANVFEPLIYFGTVDRPMLAHDWEQVDSYTWKFHLRDDVLFHDGEQFTAADVKYTFEDLLRDNERSPRQGLWYDRLDHVEIVDDFTVNFHLKEIVPPQIFFDTLSTIQCAIVPKHYHEEVGPEHAAANPIGTGPYRVTEWTRDDQVVYEFFEDHWRVSDPDFKRAIHRAIPEDATRIAEIETGGVHFTNPVPTVEYDRIAATEHANPIRMDTTRVLHWEMFHGEHDGEPALTADLRIRQAIDYAIDNQTLVDDVMGGFGVPVRGYFGENLGADNVDMIGTIPGMEGEYNFDLDRARELIAEAGHDPEEGVYLKVNACRGRYPHDADVGEVVGDAMLPLAGFDTETIILNWGAHGEQARSPGQLTHMAMSGHSPGLTVGTGMLGRFRRHYSWQEYENEEMFDLLYRACETEDGLDPARHEELVQEAQRIAMEDLPEVRMFRIENLYAMHPAIDYEPPLSENYAWLLWNMKRAD